MNKVTFEIPNYSLEKIKKEYYLNDLCVNGTAQLKNISITIQSLYFYHNILVASKYEKSIEASLCRTIFITSYSILEGIVISTGYKIQNKCRYCKHQCKYSSVMMFNNKNERCNEINAFKNADEFLNNIGILNFTSRAKQYYCDFRENRNNIHLGKNCEVITCDYNFTKEECFNKITFLQDCIEIMHYNYLRFTKKHKCFCNN